MACSKGLPTDFSLPILLGIACSSEAHMIDCMLFLVRKTWWQKKKTVRSQPGPLVFKQGSPWEIFNYPCSSLTVNTSSPLWFSKGQDQTSLVCLSCECLAKCCACNETLLYHPRINTIWHPAGLCQLEQLLPRHLLTKLTMDLTVSMAQIHHSKEWHRH